MATVKFSKELRETIIRNAKEVHEKQIVNAIGEFKREWFDTIYNKAYADYIPHMNALPLEFFHAPDSVMIEQFGAIKLEAKVILPYRYKFPKDDPANNLIKFSSWRAEIGVKDDGNWGDLATDIYAYNEKILKLRAASEEFVRSVAQIIGTYPTLAQALKAWAPLMGLLPISAIEAHNRKAERTKSEATLDMDFSKLTSAITMHKLTR